MERTNTVLLLLLLLSATLCIATTTKTHEIQKNSLVDLNSPDTKWIVELQTPDIISATTSIDETLRTTNCHACALETQQQKTLIIEETKNRIEEEQHSVINALQEQSPEAKIIHRFKTTKNAIVIQGSRHALKDIAHHPSIKSIQPDIRVQALLNESTGWMNATKVWNLTVNNQSIQGHNITIAIIDTGVDYTHPDLGGCNATNNISDGSCDKVIAGYDFYNNDSNPMDDHGHGTHCAATAAGNGTLLGVAPAAKIVAYKVLDQYGYGDGSAIIAAIEHATDPDGDGNTSDHYDVISMSLGGSGNPDDAYSTAADNAARAGVVVVIAAGNSYDEFTIGSPGTSREAITVGATEGTDEIAYFSSGGPSNYGGLKPDIVAPGVDICAAQLPGAYTAYQCIDTQHISMSGTSMATPHIAGMAALMLQKNSSWTPHDIKMIMRETARPVNDSILFTGRGFVDAYAAVLTEGTYPYAFLNSSNFSRSGVTNITGTATANNFKNYTISYGTGLDATNFIHLYTSNNSVNSGTLLTYNTSPLSDEYVTIKLEVNSNDNRTSTDYLFLYINNFDITSPTIDNVLGGTGTMNITGTVALAENETYYILYGKGTLPNNLTSNGITLTNDGNSTVIDDTLGTINLSYIDTHGIHTLYVVINGTNTSKNTSTRFIYEDLLKTGWPFINTERFTTAAPGIGELDGNTITKELVVLNELRDIPWFGEPTGTPNKTTVYALNKDGSLLPGWPINATGYIPTSPVLVDMNGDGIDEIFIATRTNYLGSYIEAYYANATPIPGWPRNTTEYITSSLHGIMINDQKALLAIDYDEKIYAWYLNGTTVPGYPLNITNTTYVIEPAIADIDQDGAEDIIFYSYYTGELNVLHSNGTPHNGWPILVDSYRYNHPIVFDVDNDGDEEILIGEYDDYIDAYEADGSNVTGYPAPAPETVWWPTVLAPLQIDNDTGLEYATTDQFWLGLMDDNGTPYQGWPGNNESTFLSIGWNEIVTGDVDGDGTADILGADWEWYHEFYGYKGNGSNLTGWPRYLPDKDEWYWNIGYYAPSITDLDGDNNTDIVLAREEGVYVYDMNTTYNQSNIYWPHAFSDDRYSNRLNQPGAPPRADTFDGNTTNLTELWAPDQVRNLYLEKAEYGSINFGNQPIDLRNVDLDGNNNVILFYNLVYINTTKYPSLNKTATITLRNITKNIGTIMKDDGNGWTHCPEPRCNVTGEDNNSINFTVQGFSYYQATEGVLINTSPTNDTIVDNTITFTCNVTGANLTNISLYHDENNWHRNTTINASPPGTNKNFSVNLSQGTHTWGCEACTGTICIHTENLTVRVGNVTFTNVIENIGTTTATITWNTNYDTNYTLSYHAGSTPTTVSDDTFETSHGTVLTELSEYTTYYYNITACTANGQCWTRAQAHFRTDEEDRNDGGGGGGGGAYIPRTITYDEDEEDNTTNTTNTTGTQNEIITNTTNTTNNTNTVTLTNNNQSIVGAATTPPTSEETANTTSETTNNAYPSLWWLLVTIPIIIIAFASAHTRKHEALINKVQPMAERGLSHQKIHDELTASGMHPTKATQAITVFKDHMHAERAAQYYNECLSQGFGHPQIQSALKDQGWSMRHRLIAMIRAIKK